MNRVVLALRKEAMYSDVSVCADLRWLAPSDDAARKVAASVCYSM